MNAVVVSILLMLVLSLCRMHVVLALIIGAFVGGIVGDLSIETTISTFNNGLGKGAQIALSYAMLGAFAIAISKSGIPNFLASKTLTAIKEEQSKHKMIKWLLIVLLLIASISSQNIIPIHIAFIPMIVPPLLQIFNHLKLDRRIIACVLTFGLITPYMFLPIGFGAIFLEDILLKNINSAGLDTNGISVMKAMAIPALGMFVGLCLAIFSYRKARTYKVDENFNLDSAISNNSLDKKTLLVSVAAIIVALGIQLIFSDSLIFGALVGILLFSLSGVIKWGQTEEIFSEGMKTLAIMGLIMIAANGFAEVLKATGDINTLVTQFTSTIQNKALVAFIMLLVGLLVTMGIGSSFSTVPIIAAIFVPLGISAGFSPLALVSIIGSAAAIGDAGSPASDSTLGPTSGLNTDGQHNHIWDTVVPTFLHYNLPLLVFGWIAAMVL